MYKVLLLDDFNQPQQWDDYIKGHPHSSIYHQLYFKKVIQDTYRHKPFYFIAVNAGSKISGVLPAFFINSFLFGKALVSLPFCDYGGILADNDEVGTLLLQKGITLSQQLKCSSFELRQISEQQFIPIKNNESTVNFSVKTSKVRMVLALPDTTDALFNFFPAKLRSQIRKPQKEGCTSRNGGIELLDDFYDVFVHNMRDLGSPVHTKELMRRMILNAPECSQLFVIYHNNTPAACSLVSGLNGTLVNPWASFKRSYQKIAPNMMLYWEMLSYAVNHGYKSFDFGRSTPGEGTFRFKEQWGAQPEQLFWYTTQSNGASESEESESDKKEMFIKVWQKLPLAATRFIGPRLRRHIHL